jgi:hypothetical protein
MWIPISIDKFDEDTGVHTQLYFSIIAAVLRYIEPSAAMTASTQLIACWRLQYCSHLYSMHHCSKSYDCLVPLSAVYTETAYHCYTLCTMLLNAVYTYVYKQDPLIKMCQLNYAAYAEAPWKVTCSSATSSVYLLYNSLKNHLNIGSCIKSHLQSSCCPNKLLSSAGALV